MTIKQISKHLTLPLVGLAAVLAFSALVFAGNQAGLTQETATVSPQANVGNRPTAEMMANTCAGCHGTAGRIGNSAFMPLAGMPADTFTDTMLDFRNDRRPSTLMGHVAKGFSEAEIRQMAAYFGGQPSEVRKP